MIRNDRRKRCHFIGNKEQVFLHSREIGNRCILIERLELAFRFIGFMVKLKFFKSPVLPDRYRIDNFHATSLDNNPLNSPANRDLRVYLPPDYYESVDKRYPVIYFLHGYGGDNKSWTVTSRLEIDQAPLPMDVIPKRMAREFSLDKIPVYEQLDEFINRGEIEPFILVQPDGSLHVSQLGNLKTITGQLKGKGSTYVNSPYSGNYANYIALDVVGYVDHAFRTIADREHRAISGASMGGYGALNLGLNYPDVFDTVAALAPGNIVPEMVDMRLYTPLYERILGRAFARKTGMKEWRDILDTYDMIFSKDAPLLASITRDEAGNMTGASKTALANWRKFDLKIAITDQPLALKNSNVMLYCDAKDEYGLCPQTRKLHETLLACGITHEFDNPDDPGVAIAPHALGCGIHIMPAFRFCSKNFK